uniref:hypothetical protein n=1 Tax=Nonomuraea bangladeshensis TaxID=404385 RepID=UPI003F493461
MSQSALTSVVSPPARASSGTIRWAGPSGTRAASALPDERARRDPTRDQQPGGHGEPRHSLGRDREQVHQDA